jgi:hypothetical protein
MGFEPIRSAGILTAGLNAKAEALAYLLDGFWMTALEMMPLLCSFG